MIVARDGDTLALVRQTDHQRQCRDMARAWGGPGVSRIPHWVAVEEAAARHDEGWDAEDRTPTLGRDGAPTDFPEVDRDRHAAFYERGIAAVEADDPRAGLVCCLHGRGLYEKRLGLDGTPPPRTERPAHERAFIAAQLARQARLERALGPGADVWGMRAFLLLQAWDALSLYLVWTGLRRGGPWELRRVPMDGAGGEATLSVSRVDDLTAAVSPWPFAAPRVDLPVTVRHIAARPYAGAADLAREFDAASPCTVPYALVAGASGVAGITPPRHAG